MTPPRDRLGRPLRSLRISVTDRCNLRCSYCMPEKEYAWLPRSDILSFEEVARLTDAFLAAGVEKVRLTGGEPLLRRDLELLVAMLAAKPGVRDLALTTNGILLEEAAPRLREAGLHRITVSIDTLRPERFRALTRRNGLDRVIAGIRAAAEIFPSVKLDTVVVRDTNEDEILELLDFAREVGAELRFIEYMDVGGATRWRPKSVVTRAEILQRLEERHGPVEEAPSEPSAPAERFRLADGAEVGIVASMTQPFCAACDRGRLTADGTFLLCLYARLGIDLRASLRGGATTEELAALLRRTWSGRADRGAEERLAVDERTPIAMPDELRANPHLEMHKRGG